MSVKNRLKNFILSQNLSVLSFEKSIRASNGYINSISRSVGIDKLESIIENYPNLDIEWLLTGKGDMLKSHPLVEVPSEGVPLIPIEAMAGFPTGDYPVLLHDCPRYIIPDLEHVDFMIRIKGQSMAPNYNSGDIVACIKVSGENWIQWNKVYVMDTVQGPLVKRLRQSTDPEKITVISDNQEYSPFEIPKADIRALGLVIATIRLE